MINYESYSEAFGRFFYTDDVTLIKKEKSGSYSRAETSETLCNIKADVQNFSGGLAREEYGLDVECQKRMYCGVNENIKEGVFVLYGGEEYEIIYATEDKLGCCAVLGKV